MNEILIDILKKHLDDYGFIVPDGKYEEIAKEIVLTYTRKEAWSEARNNDFTGKLLEIPSDNSVFQMKIKALSDRQKDYYNKMDK